MALSAKRPEDCATMAEVRAGVDAIDLALVALLGERMQFMAAAARIKPDKAAVRDEARKAQVLANVCLAADTQGIDPALARRLWDMLIEASIAHEEKLWEALHRATGRQTLRD